MALDIKPVIDRGIRKRADRGENKRGGEAAGDRTPAASADGAPATARPESHQDPATSAGRSRAPQRVRAPRKRRAAAPREPAARLADDRPYAGEPAIHLSVSVMPRLWADLKQRADEARDSGLRSSAARIVTALLHRHLPGNDDELATLAREWESTKAREFRRERTQQRTLRSYPSLLERLNGAARFAERAEHIRYGDVAIVNQILYDHLPTSAQETEELLGWFDRVLAGEVDESAVDEPEDDRPDLSVAS